MRLVSWNCQGAFRKKLQHVKKFQPDIIVVPECEMAVVSQGELFGEPPSSVHVQPPDTIHKGLGVFTFGDYKAEVAPLYNLEHTIILPLFVTGPTEFLLVAVWTLPMKRRTYAEPFCVGVEALRSEMRDSPTVLAGDFNLNANAADRKSEPHSFTKGAQMLQELGIRSVYHHDREVELGDESEEATWFMHRKRQTAGMLDYILASGTFLGAEHSLEIGKPEDWLSHSDHMPLIFDVSLESVG